MLYFCMNRTEQYMKELSMIRIAVCDDNEIELNEIRKKILKHSEDFSVAIYPSSRELWFAIQDRDLADVFILDVDMPEMDGFQLAEQITKYRPQALLIFLTAHSEFAARGYRYQALRYVHKLRMDAELYEALDAATLRLLSVQNSFLSVKHSGNYYRIPYNDILYVLRVSRLLEIHTVNETVTDRRGIRELFELLDDCRFLFIDRSCFINTDYIRYISGTDVTLINGEQLPVSRRMLANLKSYIAKEWNV